MNDNEKRRLNIFDKYSGHLHILVAAGVLNITLEFEQTFICPICTRQFSKDALDQTSKNPLTLEDAPPKSLGGHAAVLTCKECNNKAGQQVDHHLSERMNELDQREFRPGVEFTAIIEHDGESVLGKVTVSKEREIQIKHDIKKNNPKKLDVFIGSVKKNAALNIKHKENRIDPSVSSLAYLKRVIFPLLKSSAIPFC